MVELETEKKEYFKKKKKNEEEILTDIRAKLDIKKNYLIKPIPANYATFDKYLERFGIKGGKGYNGTASGRGMGIGGRFPLDQKEIWLKRCESYNKNSAKAIDPKTDQTPGPQAYSMISHWTSKPAKSRKSDEKEEKLPNYFKSTSVGVTFKPYYSSIP